MSETSEPIVSGISDERDVIDGQRVDTRAVADVPIPWKDGESYKSKDIDEVLLADGRIVFQCNHNAERCNYWNASVTSVQTHQKIHSGNARAKRAEQELTEARAAAQAAQEELEKQRRRRSEAVKKAHLTRKAKKNGHALDADVSATRAVSIDELRQQLKQVGEDFTVIVRQVEQMAGHFITIVDMLDELEITDPALVEKAAKYDALRGLIS